LIKLVPLVALESESGLGTNLGMVGAVILLIPLPSVRLHDRLTGTRVISAPSTFLERVRMGLVAILDRLPRSRRLARETAAAEPTVAAVRFGTFEARHRLLTDDDGSLWVANDPLLRREVWVREHRRLESHCTETRRAVERPARLRWIATGDSEGRPWDAYDAPDAGASLWACSAGERRRPWRVARRVLLNLAAEILAARADGTMPPRMTLAQVIAARDGGVVLLDEPVEPDTLLAESFCSDSEGLRSLFQVLVCALATGDLYRASEIGQRVDVARLPVSDHDLLEELWNPSLDPLQVIASLPQRLANEHRRIAEVSVRARITHVLAIGLIDGLAWVGAPSIVSNGVQSFLDGWASASGESALLVSTWEFLPALAGFFGVLFPVASSLAFRGGLALRLEGVEVCTFGGRPATTFRLLLRSLPLAVGTAVVTYTLFAGRPALSAELLASFIVVAVVGVLLNPARSLGDMIAGTYLRPK
jgi:hypothetical protein